MWGRFAFGRRTLRWRAIKLRLWNDGEKGCGRAQLNTGVGRWAARVKRAVTARGKSGEWPNTDTHSLVMARFTRASHH